MVGKRLSNDDIKRLVVQRKQLQNQRDGLTAGLTPESIGGNPLALMTKMPDLMSAFGLTQQIESISNELIVELALRVGESAVALEGI